jgi:hypothetical protein
MRAVQQAQILQILHHVANRRGRNLFRHRPRQGARTDRLSAFQIAFDHPPKHLARAIRHFRQQFGTRGHRLDA